MFAADSHTDTFAHRKVVRSTACCPDKNLTGSSVAVLSSLMLNFGRGRKQRKNAFFTDKQPGFWRASPITGGCRGGSPCWLRRAGPECGNREHTAVAAGKGRHGPGAANAPLTGGGPALHPGTGVSRWLRRAQIAPEGPSPSAAAGGADALAHAQRRPLSVSGAN